MMRIVNRAATPSCVRPSRRDGFNLESEYAHVVSGVEEARRRVLIDLPDDFSS